jgi:hypothetical protein
MYESPRELSELRATRKDWTVTTSIDPSTTRLLVTVSSEAGWGNAGVRNFDRHVDAIKARVRRVILKQYPGLSFSLVVHSTRSWGTGVMQSITYSAKAL